LISPLLRVIAVAAGLPSGAWKGLCIKATHVTFGADRANRVRSGRYWRSPCGARMGRQSTRGSAMRLAVQIALNMVLAWLICLSIAVAVLAAIRMPKSRRGQLDSSVRILRRTPPSR